MKDYILKNHRLSLKISAPGEVYKGSRFDWMGMITEVILDGKDTFCSQESLIDGIGSGGRGLYNEFGIEEPIGYDDTEVGEKFPKIGVGLLTKDNDKAYDFFHTYEVKAFENSIKIDYNSITFICKSEEINGYAVEYIKKISIRENELIVEYCVENTGVKNITTTEYCHNFVAINNNLIGTDYSLSFSYPVDIDNKPEILSINKNEITWNDMVNDVFYCKLRNFSREKEEYFELVHKPSGVGFRETSYFELERVAIWGMPHVVSPEAFVKININPEEKQSWKRTYKFFN